jgi:hypothetical protein
MLKLESSVSLGNVSFNFTKGKIQEWEEDPDRKGFGGRQEGGQSKVDWLCNESGSISGSRKDLT